MTHRIIDQYHVYQFFLMFKKLMHNRLISFVRNNNILLETQNGSKENKSTETATQSLLESVHASMTAG